MITLITAVPGSGKTLWTIGEILKLQKEGRRVYANINGLLIPDVHPAPDDWRDTPEGSVVIYDECQEIFPSNAKPGVVSDERLTAMERHRHTGHDLYFITQAPTFVHHHIRKLVGRHIHLYRPNGIQGANLYTWNFTCDSPNDRQEQERADHVLWKYPKEYFKLYKSATIHTHKFRFPKKIGALLALILVGFGFVGYSLKDGVFSNTPNTPTAQAAEVAQAVPPPAAVPTAYQWSDAPPATPVAGCIASEKRGTCMCFDKEGTTLSMDHAQCLSVIRSPLPRSFGLERKES